MRTNPAYRKAVESTDASIQKYIEQHQNDPQLKTAAALYTIPVVVHVVHTGGAVGTIYNPTDAQIQGAITYLNNVYNGTYPGLEGVGDMQVQFALATKDPNCNVTNGIDRVDGSSLTNYVTNGVNSGPTGSGVDHLTLKGFDRWNPSNYYNIWVVNKIDGKDGTSGQFIAGFAYFAGSPSSYDGTIMLATQMVSGQKTLPHEIGHALNLYHPFYGSPDAVTCPVDTNCTKNGDMVCDTDPITYNQTGGVVNFTCRTGTNSCTGTSYSINTEHNFMNYTSCYTLFTAGQKARVLAAMSIPSRMSLATSYSLGTGYPAATFSPAGAASCSPQTSGTGLAGPGGVAGLMGITIGSKTFSSDDAFYDGGYVDRTAKCDFLYGLHPGSTYTIIASVLGLNLEQLRIWIDYNNDGVFNNATEQILYANNIPMGSYPTVSTSFTVPVTAVTNTVLRMRISDEVGTAYSAGFAISSACYAPTYGQVEDYPVFLSTTLPATFEFFNGIRKDEGALLTWRTSAELNLREFEIERSSDGSTFSNIGNVAASNKPAGASYSFTDPLNGNETKYYRLKIVDIDGAISYSKVVTVGGSQKFAGIRIRNNPFVDHIGLDFDSPQTGNIQINLFNVQGQNVFEANRNAGGLTHVEVSIPATLAAGTYVVQVISSTGNLVQKLVKQ